MVAWEKIIFFLSFPLHSDKISYGENPSFQKHVMIHLPLLAINRLIENDVDLLSSQLRASIKNSIQPHSSSLKSPKKLIYQPVLVSIKCVSRFIFEVVFFQPTVLELMIFEDKPLLLLMEIHIALYNNSRNKIFVSF
jgi:hypothetical protein